MTRLPLAGVVLPDLDEPDAAALRAAADDRDRHGLVRAGCGPDAPPAFTAEVVATLERLERRGLDVLREAT